MAQSKFVNKKLRETILEKLREGHFESSVCDYCEISRSAYYDWLARGDIERDEPDSEYAEFARQVKRAKAEAELNIVGDIKSAGKHSWQALAWILERTRPDKFAKAEWRLSKLNEQGKKEDDDFVIDLSEGDKDEDNPPLPGH